nr:LAGLIDADG family homing endonuclease [Neobacillus sp. Marseille-Q6967]
MENWEASYIAGIIDGEGTVTLSRVHENEFRRPFITIASTDIELLVYIQSLTGGTIINKKNYNPERHKDSFILTIKKKETVFFLLKKITPYLRVDKKRKRAELILNNYNNVTSRKENIAQNY